MTRNTYEVPGQAGKLAVVTGASDGLGLQIATRLALAGADLVLPVRNPRQGSGRGRAHPRHRAASQGHHDGSRPRVPGVGQRAGRQTPCGGSPRSTS